MCKIKVSTINDDKDLKFPHEAFHILCLVQEATAVLTHNLFVLEQAEYLKEGKDWEMVAMAWTSNLVLPCLRNNWEF